MKKDISGNMNKAKQLLGKLHINFLDEKCQCSSTVCLLFANMFLFLLNVVTCIFCIQKK